MKNTKEEKVLEQFVRLLGKIMRFQKRDLINLNEKEESIIVKLAQTLE